VKTGLKNAFLSKCACMC